MDDQQQILHSRRQSMCSAQHVPNDIRDSAVHASFHSLLWQYSGKSYYIWNVHWHPKVTTGASAASTTFFSPWQKDGLERLSPWVSVVEDLAPEVLILVCDRVCESGELDYSLLRFGHFHVHNGITLRLHLKSDFGDVHSKCLNRPRCHSTRGPAVVFRPRLWAGGTQPSRPTGWRW